MIPAPILTDDPSFLDHCFSQVSESHGLEFGYADGSSDTIGIALF